MFNYIDINGVKSSLFQSHTCIFVYENNNQKVPARCEQVVTQYYVTRHRYLSILLRLEAAGVLATFVCPNHIVYLCSWGV